MGKIKLIENRSEIGAGTRGSSLGLDALKVADFNLGTGYFKKKRCFCSPKPKQFFTGSFTILKG